MRRMISQKLQDLLKKLSKSIWADDNGNVEIGKNLEVDGDVHVNGNIDVENDINCTELHATDLYTTNDEGNRVLVEPSLYSKAKYHHFITIWGMDAKQLTSNIFIDAYLSKNTSIDSVQDLTTLLGGAKYLCTGQLQFDADNTGSQAFFIEVGNTISDTAVYDAFDSNYPFSELFTTIGKISDDVSIPR